MAILRTNISRSVALVLAAVLVFAACSSDKKSSTSANSGSGGQAAASSAPAPTGSPINVGLIGSFTGSQASSSNQGQTVGPAWERYVNEQLGGINGHPVTMDVTDTKGDAAAAQAAITAEQGKNPLAWVLATPSTDPTFPRIRVRVDVVERLGTETHLVFAVDAPRVSAEELRDAVDADAGDDILLADDDRATFTAVVDAHHHVDAGQTVELVADPRRLYGFDPRSGEALAGEPGSVRPPAWEGDAQLLALNAPASLRPPR